MVMGLAPSEFVEGKWMLLIRRPFHGWDFDCGFSLRGGCGDKLKAH